ARASRAYPGKRAIAAERADWHRRAGVSLHTLSVLTDGDNVWLGAFAAPVARRSAEHSCARRSSRRRGRPFASSTLSGHRGGSTRADPLRRGGPDAEEFCPL